MSGAVSRTSRFWLVGLVLIAFNLFYVTYSLIALKEKLSVTEAVFHGLILLAGIALLDLGVARDLFTRVTRLRHGRGPDAAA